MPWSFHTHNGNTLCKDRTLSDAKAILECYLPTSQVIYHKRPKVLGQGQDEMSFTVVVQDKTFQGPYVYGYLANYE